MPYRLAPDSVAARFGLGMIPTTGILYANATPLIVSALEQSPDFSAETAGYVFAANMFGTSLGGLLIIAVVRALPWRLSCIVLASCIACLDLVSIWLNDPTTLMVLRFLHGLAGGAMMGFGALVIARAGNTDRTFGIMIAIQMIMGGMMAAGLAPLISSHGVYPVWTFLISFSLLCLVILPFLSDYPEPAPGQEQGLRAASARPPVLIALTAGLCLFIYQAGQMAAYTYIFEHGQTFGLSNTFMGWTSAASLWIGVLSALAAAYWSTRSGYVRPAVAGAILTAAAVALLIYPTAPAYLIASMGLGIFFCATIPYLLSLLAEMDDTGRLASVGSFVSSFGLASGPFLAATLLGLGASFVDILIFAVVAMTLAGIMAIAPARHLEQSRRHSPGSKTSARLHPPAAAAAPRSSS